MSMNINDTVQYYKKLTADDLCQCNNCKNFYAQIRRMYPDVAEYLDGIGVDIEKPHESWSVELDDDNLMYMDVQYVVLGSSEDFSEVEISGVKIHLAESYPPTDLTEEHFVIETGPYYLSMLY